MDIVVKENNKSVILLITKPRSPLILLRIQGLFYHTPKLTAYTFFAFLYTLQSSPAVAFNTIFVSAFSRVI